MAFARRPNQPSKLTQPDEHENEDDGLALEPAPASRKAAAPPMDDDIPVGLLTDPAEIDRRREEIDSQAGRSELYRVKFRIVEDETKRVLFRKKLGVLFAHYVAAVARNGMRISELVPCSHAALGECRLCEAGMRASAQTVYDVVDITGFSYKKDGKNVSVKNVGCFYLMPAAREKMFSKFMASNGGPAAVFGKKIVEIECIGSGAQTTHMYTMAADQKINSAEIAKVEPMEAQVRKYFAVPSLREQEALVKREIAMRSEE